MENDNPFTAAEELNVDYIVDGAIRLIGEKIRVSVQLLDVKNKSTQRAEVFDEEFTDILEIEDLISERIVGSLVPHLTGVEKVKLSQRATNQVEAYKSFMRGRYYWNQFTMDTIPKSVECFQEAVSLDPNYAPAYVGIADYYHWACIYGLLPSSELYLHSKEAIEKALEIDPNLGEAYATTGLYHSNQTNWKESEKYYKRAIEISPHYPLAHEWYAAILASLGRFAEAEREIDLAEELNPMSVRQTVLSAWTLYQIRKYDRVLSKVEKIMSLDENHPQGFLQLGNVYCQLGRHDEAIEAGLKAINLMPGAALLVYPTCFALAAADRLPEAEKLVENLEELKDINYVKPYFLAMANFAVNRIDSAYFYLEKSIDEKTRGTCGLQLSPNSIDGGKICISVRFSGK